MEDLFGTIALQFIVKPSMLGINHIMQSYFDVNITAHSQLTNIAKAMLKTCEQEMQEIENCPDCYQHANTRSADSWFMEVCVSVISCSSSLKCLKLRINKTHRKRAIRSYHSKSQNFNLNFGLWKKHDLVQNFLRHCC